MGELMGHRKSKKSNEKEESITLDKKSNFKTYVITISIILLCLFIFMILDSSDKNADISDYPIRFYVEVEDSNIFNTPNKIGDRNLKIYSPKYQVNNLTLRAFNFKQKGDSFDADLMIIFTIKNNTKEDIIPNLGIMIPKDVIILEECSPPGKHKIFESDYSENVLEGENTVSCYTSEKSYDGNYSFIRMEGNKIIPPNEEEIFRLYLRANKIFERINREKYVFGIQIERNIDKFQLAESNASFVEKVLVLNTDIKDLVNINIGDIKYTSASSFKDGAIQIILPENFIPLQEGLSLLPNKMEKIETNFAYTYIISEGQYSYCLFKDKNIIVDSYIKRNLILTGFGAILGVCIGFLFNWNNHLK